MNNEQIRKLKDKAEKGGVVEEMIASDGWKAFMAEVGRRYTNKVDELIKSNDDLKILQGEVREIMYITNIPQMLIKEGKEARKKL